MKHTWSVTQIIILVFLISQIVGLSLLTLSQEITIDNGKIKVDYKQTSLGERPDIKGTQSIIYLATGVGIGTIILLLLAKLKLAFIWKAWFFTAVTLSLTIALEVIINEKIAFITGIILAALKIYKPNVWIHNITEVLVYSGIAILIVPLFDIYTATIILMLFSIYDFIAVYKSKHMITLAKFQTSSNVFAGLNIPYKTKTRNKQKTSKKQAKQTTTSNAILGGGDIVIPLLFTGTVIKHLIEHGYTQAQALGMSLIITICCTIALLHLFITSKKDTYYPAIPPIAAGCLIGLNIILLIT